jgi:hypothetical protein
VLDTSVSRRPVPSAAPVDTAVGTMREPLSRTKKIRLRRWVRRELTRAHRGAAATAGDVGRRDAFTRHCARAAALIRIFGVTGPACDGLAFLRIEHRIDARTWNAAYLDMRAEIEAKLRSLGLPTTRAPWPDDRAGAGTGASAAEAV